MIVKSNEPIRVETDDGWVVSLNPSPWSDNMELWIAQVKQGKFYSGNVDKDGYLELKEVKEGLELQNPTLRINRRIWEGLAQALRGITPQVDKKEVDAELKATKYHLEDMRKLMKIK